MHGPCMGHAAWVYIVFAVVVVIFLYVIKRSRSFFTHNQLAFIGISNQGFQIKLFISGMYQTAEEDAIETQLKGRAAIFAQELVKVNTAHHEGI